MQPVEAVAERIHVIRGMRVMLDADLARLYGVETRRLNEQVRRNRGRFPPEFMIQLDKYEFARLMSQIATSKKGRGGIRKLPLAFTEHGAIMAATVLNSPRAIEMSVYVVRAFVRLHGVTAAHKEIGKRLGQLEEKFGTHDRAISKIIEALRELMQPKDDSKRRRIGFVQND